MRQATRRKRFLPFAHLGAVCVLRVDGVRLDGRTVRLPPDAGPDTPISLHDHPMPRHEVELDLRLALPDRLQECLLDGETSGAVTAVALAECASTWLRAVAPMRVRSAGELAGTLVVPARGIEHQFEISAHLCRATEAPPAARRAWERGARLASAPARRVVVRSGRPARGGLIDVRPARFTAAETLRRWADQGWYLQVTADPPVLWLNEELPEVAAVLGAKGTTGRRARLRDLLFRSIALQAWTTLFHAAAAGFSRDEGEPVYAAPWHEAVLRVVAEHAFPELPRGGRLGCLLEHVDDARANPDHLGALLEDVALGLQRQLEVAAVADKAATELLAEAT